MDVLLGAAVTLAGVAGSRDLCWRHKGRWRGISPLAWVSLFAGPLLLLGAPARDAVAPWYSPWYLGLAMGPAVVTFAGVVVDSEQCGPAAGLCMMAAPCVSALTCLVASLLCHSLREWVLIAEAVASVTILAVLAFGRSAASD